jgi:hypothetical protein
MPSASIIILVDKVDGLMQVFVEGGVCLWAQLGLLYASGLFDV